jgi:hypothetical protein
MTCFTKDEKLHALKVALNCFLQNKAQPKGTTEIKAHAQLSPRAPLFE